jgi:hypothetical protein
MYKGKKVITMNRPWYRHPIFPWGWYSLVQDKIDAVDVMSDGFYKPNDGGGGRFKYCPNYSESKEHSGTIIAPKD